MRVVSEGPVKIIKTTVEGAWKRRAKGQRLIVRDKECAGLALVVNPAAMRWEYAYRPRGTDPDGKRWPNRTVTLGTPESLSPDAARTEVGRIKGEAMAGRDPVAERKAAVAARREKAVEDAFTFGKMVDGWASARTGDRRPGYIAEATSSLKRNLAGWLTRPASAIKPRDAARVFDAIKTERGAIAANRTHAYARAAFGWAVKRHMLAVNPLLGIERPSRETARDRVLTAAEVGEIWRATDKLASPYGPFVKLLLLTLQRREEVAAMRWDELDDAKAPTVWTLPGERAKNGKAHIVHLAGPARAILRAMTRLDGCPYVFPAQGRPLGADATGGRRRRVADVGPVSAFSEAKRIMDTAILAARREADPEAEDMPDWRLHDFRRAGVTALAGMGIAPHIADKLLNHVSGAIRGVAAVYQRAEFLTERKAALEAWATYVVSAAEGRTAESNVVTLPARAG
jgi:integrase